MKPRDLALIYHTGSERACVGIAEIVKGPYPDPRAGNPKLVAVDIMAKQPLEVAVTLQQIKADPAFVGFDLLRISRLSVVPVPAEMWKRLLTLAKMA